MFQKTQLNEIGLVVFAEGSVGVEQETCQLICGSKPKVPPPSLDQSKLITQPDIIRPRNVERTKKSTIIEVTDKQERERYRFGSSTLFRRHLFALWVVGPLHENSGTIFAAGKRRLVAQQNPLESRGPVCGFAVNSCIHQ